VRGADDGTVISDHTQKIFPIGGSGTIRLAFSTSGSASIPSCDREGIAFDFLTEIHRATGALSTRRYHNLADYARKAYGAVHRRLKEAKLTGRLDYPESETLDLSEGGCTITRVLIDGYHEGIPSRVTVRFYHEHQALGDLEVLQQELARGAPWVYGSEKIWDLMFGPHSETGNQTFSVYGKQSVSLVSHPNEALRIHAQMAHAYISACSGAEGHAIDPEICAWIGGHIHIATITPKDGFQWLSGFEPWAY
jgi:hypothetical protein